MAPTQQDAAKRIGDTAMDAISGAVRDAAVVIATVADPRAIRINAAIINGIRIAGIGRPTTASPNTLPIPLTLITLPREPPAPVISIMIPVSLILSFIMALVFF